MPIRQCAGLQNTRTKFYSDLHAPHPRQKRGFYGYMKDIITSPLLLAMVIIGLLYIVGFSLVYLKKAYTHCLELGISKEDLKNVIKSSLVFSIVPSLSIVVGLFALISVLGTVWSWWRLSVIGHFPMSR